VSRRGAVCGSFAAACLRAMELIAILNRCCRFQGFVYQHARFTPDRKSVEVSLRSAKAPPQSARAAIEQYLVTTDSPNSASSSSLGGGVSSSFCTPCDM
jgi:hypothetical protein